MTAGIDVLVAGLGPAGAATAIRLARAGHRVVAVDRARFPREKACSEYLSPEAVRHLAALGLLERVERSGMPLQGATVIGPRGATVTGLFAKASVSPFRPNGLSIPRRVLDNAMVDLARECGVQVIEDAALLDIDRSGDQPIARVRQGQAQRSIQARVIVGADGLRSATAKAIGRRRYEPLRRYGFVAHVGDVSGMGATAEMHVGSGGYVGLNAIGNGLSNVAVVASGRESLAAKGDPTGFWFDFLERLPGVRGRVNRGKIARPVMVAGPFAVWSSRVVVDGVLLVGDAADFFDPFTGEGICAGLRGAELAATTIAAALASGGPITAAALAPYQRARRAAFGGKWAVERMIGYGMLMPRLFDRAVGRLAERNLGHTLIGVTGDFVPAGQVLRPGFLAAMVV